MARPLDCRGLDSSDCRGHMDMGTCRVCEFSRWPMQPADPLGAHFFAAYSVEPDKSQACTCGFRCGTCSAPEVY